MNTNNTQLIQNQDVVVISDLHVGDPNEANLDDFRTDSNLSELLLKVIPGEIKRPTTLVINGDFNAQKMEFFTCQHFLFTN